MTQPPLVIPATVEVPQAEKTTLANGAHALHARLGRLRSAAHHLRVPRRIGRAAGSLLGIGRGEHARRRHARHDGAADRRTARLLRLLFRRQHRPGLRLYQLLHALQILRTDAGRWPSRCSCIRHFRRRSCAPTAPSANSGWPSSVRKWTSKPAKRSPGRCSGREHPYGISADENDYDRLTRGRRGGILRPPVLHGRQRLRGVQRTHRRAGTGGRGRPRGAARRGRSPKPGRRFRRP